MHVGRWGERRKYWFERKREMGERVAREVTLNLLHIYRCLGHILSLPGSKDNVLCYRMNDNDNQETCWDLKRRKRKIEKG